MRIHSLPGVTAILFLACTLIAHIHAQPCNTTLAYTFGEPDKTERGYSLVAARDNQSYYVTGLKEDSVFLLQVDLNGKVLFTKTFDVVTGKTDHANMIFMDSDGMLIFTGMTNDQQAGGSVITFKYDVINDEILWTREFVTAWDINYNYSVMQLGPGGNYVIANNPHYNTNGNDDSELIELEKNTGQVVPKLSKVYDLESSEAMSQILFHNGFIYGSGRYTSAGATQFMRNTLTKIDPANGNTIWAVMGHKSHTETARLYGVDLVIHDNLIYSMTTGDPSGVGGTNWKVFLQCFTLEGQLVWIKEYEIPGNHDYGLEVAYAEGGIVALVQQRNSTSGFVMLKVDTEGAVQWARQYPATTIINTAEQLIAVDDKLVFTGTTADGTGESDVLLIQTNAEGIPDNPCVPYQTIQVAAKEVVNPVFYSVTPDVSEAAYDINIPETISRTSRLVGSDECAVTDTIETTITVTICDEESYEGYTSSGTYEDAFISADGCDSIRTLHLTVEACQPDCGALSSNIFGEAFVDEQGRCITASTLESAVYIAGNRDNNTLLIKVDLNGDIIWTRVLDLVQEGDEVPAGITEDSDGMLVVVGTGMNYIDGGVVYAFRYDPAANSILWANQYIHSPNDMAWGVIEKVPGGNYVFNLQPNFYVENYLDAEVVEIDRNTGETVTTLSKNYRIIGTETLFEIAYHDGAIYGTGRYKDGGEIDDLRTTLVKLDGDDGDQQWVKMGHRITEHPARLYGDDLVIENEAIYVFSHGDPDGQSTTNTDIFIQKTDLNGNLIWIYEYELPGEADYTHDIIAADGGLIVLGVSLSEEQFYMFKIDSDGSVLWGQQYVVSGVTGDVEWERGNPLLTKAGDHYFFTGCVINSTGDKDLLIVQTDLEGNVSEHCLHSEAINIDQITLDNIAWYDRAVNQFEATHEVTGRQPQIEAIELLPSAACSMPDTLFSELTISICQGQSFEDYTESGIYQDTFTTSEGCDSIRILYLTVYSCSPIITYDLDLCRSYMSDGSIMDYSEFIPEYPNTLSCGDIEATNLFRTPPQENKHSCTGGMEGTLAMCVSALATCTYLPGNAASVVLEFTMTPDADSAMVFNKLEFYEKAPASYSWIDGPSGPNNYPRYYGIRILKNGTQIFEQHDISTTLSWSLQSYTFNDIEDFRVTTTSTFRIELLPYCQINNGAVVSAWDLDNIKVYGSCAPILENMLIGGQVSSWNDIPVHGVQMYLSQRDDFAISASTLTQANGTFSFTDLSKYGSYFVKGERDIHLLQGVSTLDLVAMQKHLLGKASFVTLDQYIAADINHSGTVNAMDLLDLRKVLLGVSSQFPNNTSWRFGVQPVNMQSTQISDFEEIAYIESLTASVHHLDFLGIKIGDVSRDTQPGVNGDSIATRSVKTYDISIPDKHYVKGQTMTIDFMASAATDVEGIQLAIQLRHLEVLDIKAGKIPVTAAHFNVDDTGILRVSWNDLEAINVAKQDILFTLVVKANQSGNLVNDFEPAMHVLPAEIYTVEEAKHISFNIITEDAGPVTSNPFQVEIAPNPFRERFVIDFFIPRDGLVKIQVFTPMGISVFESEREYAAGNHSSVIHSDQWHGGNTVVFCRVLYDGESITRKIVKWE